MRGPAPRISSNASAALTLCQSRPESLLWFDSCVEPSHNEMLACCSRIMFLYVGVVDRHTNRHSFSSLFLQCCAKKSTLLKIRQQTEHQCQLALSCLQPAYSKEACNACEHWSLKKTLLGKALAEGSQSLRVGNRGRNTPQHSPSRKKNNHGQVRNVHAVPFPAEFSPTGDTQKRRNDNCMERHTLQVDA